MAVKVVRTGIQDRTLYGTCPVCNSLIECLQSDVLKHYVGSDKVWCPNCGSFVYVSPRRPDGWPGGPPEPRSKENVLRDRATVVGCCEQFADRLPCDCLETAGRPLLRTRTCGDGTCYRLRDGGPEVFHYDKEAITAEQVVRELLELERK